MGATGAYETRETPAANDQFPGGIPVILWPADRCVLEYHRALVRKILVDSVLHRLMLDGQDMNGVPACYNPDHHHAQPEQSVEALPDFFKAIYDTALGIVSGHNAHLPVEFDQYLVLEVVPR